MTRVPDVDVAGLELTEVVPYETWLRARGHLDPAARARRASSWCRAHHTRSSITSAAIPLVAPTRPVSRRSATQRGGASSGRDIERMKG